MTTYPIRSTARQFFDSDGTPCTLSQLVKSEPEWAVNRIFSLEEDQVKLLQALKLLNKMGWEYYDDETIGGMGVRSILDNSARLISKLEAN